mmetsp:Transcript_87758/g.204232  ORF Transcript_87758/g.204232 Transcript_87758/m.204232 type:complete len:231 (+) Transcript_87758:635-1327(+)
MASLMDACACCASSVVLAFSAFSLFRRSVASLMSASISATSAESEVTSFCSWAMAASRPSTSLVRLSTCWLLDVRVCSFVASSLSHQPLCSASRVACIMSLVMSSSMSFLTFANGSCRACMAMVESAWLSSRLDSSRRKSAARDKLDPSPAERNCASATDGDLPLPDWRNEGKCFAAVAATSSLARMATAFSSTSNSLERSSCRVLYSCSFCWQSLWTFCKYSVSIPCLA